MIAERPVAGQCETDWPVRCLDDIASQRAKKILPAKDDHSPYVALEHIAPGGSLLGYTEARESLSHKTVFQAGDTLFGKLRPNLRKVARVDFDGVCSTDILALFAQEPSDASFLTHLLASDTLYSYAMRDITGTKMPRTSWEHLRKFEFLCPPPETRGAIAAVLDAIDEGIARTEAVIAATETLRKALLEELLTRGVPGWHAEWKQAPGIGTIPADWDVVRLAKLVESIVYGPRFPASKYSAAGNVATLRTTDITDSGRISLGTMPLAALSVRSLEHLMLRSGDLVITRSGSCGIAAVFPGYDLPVLPGAFLLRARTRPDIQPEFMRLWFNSAPGRQATSRIQAGGVQKNVNAVNLGALLVPLPPARERTAIAEALTRVEECLISYGGVLSALQPARAQVAGALLTGQVRVPPPGGAPA